MYQASPSHGRIARDPTNLLQCVLFAWPEQRRLQNQLPDNVITRDSTCTNFTPDSPPFFFPFPSAILPISSSLSSGFPCLPCRLPANHYPCNDFSKKTRGCVIVFFRYLFDCSKQFSSYNSYLNLRNTNETWSVKTTKGKVIIGRAQLKDRTNWEWTIRSEQIRITVEYGERLGKNRFRYDCS